MEGSLSNKNKIILLKRGGRVWVSEEEAQIAGEAMLAKEGVIDIDGQLIEATEIRAIVNADTYQTTQEKRIEERRTAPDTNLSPNRGDCKRCDGSGFVLVSHHPKSEYDPVAEPCSQCNPNPPRLH